VPGASSTTITFYVNFSPPKGGLGFDISFDRYYSGQKGCAGASGIDGHASCEGRSGMLPYQKTVTVTFSTSAGKCFATYKSSSQ
jgi:hypothetical protein